MEEIVVGAGEKKSFVFVHDSPAVNERIIRLAGIGASVEVDEIVRSGAVQSKVTVFHDAKGTVSKVRTRGVLRKGERSSAHATIVIPSLSPGCVSSVSQKFLLLDSSAGIDAVPSLEIEANDVLASHSTAVAPLDERSLFYLESRGVSRDEALSLMVEGFLGHPEGSK